MWSPSYHSIHYYFNAPWTQLIQTADLQLSVRIAFSSTYHQTRLEQTGSWVSSRSRFDPYVLPLWQIIFTRVEAVCLALISIECHKPMKLRHLLINPEWLYPNIFQLQYQQGSKTMKVRDDWICWVTWKVFFGLVVCVCVCAEQTIFNPLQCSKAVWGSSCNWSAFHIEKFMQVDYAFVFSTIFSLEGTALVWSWKKWHRNSLTHFLLNLYPHMSIFFYPFDTFFSCNCKTQLCQVIL